VEGAEKERARTGGAEVRQILRLYLGGKGDHSGWAREGSLIFRKRQREGFWRRERVGMG
jgi:hypothetical protein